MNNKILTQHDRTLRRPCLWAAFPSPPMHDPGEDNPTNDSGVDRTKPQKGTPYPGRERDPCRRFRRPNKQLITVTTKNGNYFYILVDRDDEGENTVHFLNQVDEADLMALMEERTAEAAPAVCSCTEKCEGGRR